MMRAMRRQTRVATLAPLALLLAACGEVSSSGPDDAGDGGNGTAIDAAAEPDAPVSPVDAATAGCTWGALYDLPFTNVNDTDSQGSAALTGTALVVFFTVVPDQAGGQADVFDADRKAIIGEFSAPRAIPELSSLEDERDLETSFTGEEIFFLRGSATDIKTARRSGTAAVFGMVQSTGLVGTSPAISNNGLHLYYVDPTLAKIMRVSRAGAGAPWEAPVEVGSSGVYQWIDVSADERRVLLSGGPGGSAETPAIAIATRPTVDESFGEPASAGDSLIGDAVNVLKEASWNGDESLMAVTVQYGNGSTDLYLTTCE